MGEVGLEHEVVGQLVDDGPHRVALEPEHPVDLPVEVLAGQEAVGVVLVGAHVEPLPVHALAEEGQPAGAVLDRHEAEVGVALAHAAQHDLGDVLGVAEEDQRALLGEVHLLGLVDRALEVLRRVQEPDVEVHAEAHLLGLAEQGLPVVVDQAGQADLVVAGREQHALVAHVVGPLHLGHRLVEVPERQHHHRDEPTGVGRAPLDQPVVVGPHAVGGQLRRHLVQEHVAVEPEDVRVQHLVVDADRVVVGQALLGVDGGQEGLAQPLRVRRRELRPAGLGEGADAVELLVADVPVVLLAPLVEAHVGDEVTPLGGREPRRPEVGRLDDVGIGVDDRVALAEGHGPPPVRE